jgi:hypothetical protein
MRAGAIDWRRGSSYGLLDNAAVFALNVSSNAAKPNLMEHRHLIGDSLSLAAIDDIIERGQRDDWARLGRAAMGDHGDEIVSKIERLCEARRANAKAMGEQPSQSFTAWECFIARLKSR